MKRKEFCIILVKMRIFILVFISLSCLSINSQEIIFECNRIVEGDSLVQRKMWAQRGLEPLRLGVGFSFGASNSTYIKRY